MITTHEISLVCWHCGKKRQVMVNHLPQFAFEVVMIANAAGFHGDIDIEHSRALVFCSKEHSDLERKKNGSFRLRPKGVGE